MDELAQSFVRLGLPEKQAADIAQSAKASQALGSLVAALPPQADGSSPRFDPKTASLLAQWASAGTQLNPERRMYGANAIIDGRLASAAQLDAAAKFLKAVSPGQIDRVAFETACGVGVVVSREECFEIASKHTASSPAISDWSSLSKALGTLRSSPELRWAAPLDIKEATEQAFVARFGPKPSAPARGAKSGPAAAPNAKGKAKAAEAPPAKEPDMFEVGLLSQLHNPGGNPQTDPRLTEEHLRATGARVITRFPPEPNGFLHIGHSKAIAVNFGYAAYHHGTCNLRYDDTNPQAEEQVYFDSILEIVRWLGFEPHLITYSSDHFQRLYELAVELTKRSKAYVCFCTGAEIKANRGGDNGGPRRACAHRDAPVADNLAAFEKMKDGTYGPNEAILRMKQDFEDGNPQMWDLVAYRVLNASHHRTGSDWRIYPTYDFTHCLCDSFENITCAVLVLDDLSHSLCTTEFIQARVSYEWLCHALDVYTPRQYEYGRLNIEGTVMSKRKILKLVKGGFVDSWDDPRLHTLIALRRRGVPPEAILAFVNGLGVSTAPSSIPIHRFEQSVRQYLELSTPRLMMVLRPLEVVIENLADDFALFVERAVHPKVPAMGVSKAPFTRRVFIDASDFRTASSKDFFRLAPGSTVGLLGVPAPITCTTFESDADGRPAKLVCRYEDGPTPPKPKAWIQWIAVHEPSGSPVVIDETRIYKPLFKSANPAALPDFLADVNPDSLELVTGALIEVGFWSVVKAALTDAKRKAKERLRATHGTREDAPSKSEDQTAGLESVRFQGMRTAYFTVDRTTQAAGLSLADEDLLRLETKTRKEADDRLVLNLIVSLKEDAGKAM